MKKIFRIILVNFFALWLVNRIFPAAIDFQWQWKTLFLAAIALGLIDFAVKPLIKLLLLPITLLTLGTFRWVVNVLVLYLVTAVVPGFAIQAFGFPGFSYQGFSIPAFYTTTLYALIIVSFSLSLITSFIYWLIKK